MASATLHIKDSYDFELPKGLWSGPTSKQQYTGAYETWLRLDPQFQQWEAERFYPEYAQLRPGPEPKEKLFKQYEDWKHDHAHAGKPFWRFLQEEGDREWYQQRAESSHFRHQWRDAIEKTSGRDALAAFRSDASPQWAWSANKLAAYHQQLSGKILIPQPFGRLRNLYEKEWGIGISRFIVIEVGVALVLWILFSWLSRRVTTEIRPRGSLWNLLELFVVFVRDEIARPVIGHEPPVAHVKTPELHHADHGGSSQHMEPHVAENGAGTDETLEGGHEPAHHHDPRYDADRFVPLLLTMFFFVLGCNLAGMLPWVGSPTAEWGTTSAIAIVTFATGILFGMRRFGFFGYFLNQIPAMELPLVMAIVLKPLIFLIEILGMCIKHSILSVRLLANMAAGHLVLLSIMILAFSVEGAASHYWSIAAVSSVAGSVVLSCLELFVAFLQAYIFTFLSAMFIGAAMHSH